MRPILYSFRRCPYAMRARLALWASNQVCELREVVLRNKPPELLAASAKATVPVLVLPGGEILDQSLDIMLWALRQNDPAGWLEPTHGTLGDMLALVARVDGNFKHHLDRYKYPGRYEENSTLPNTHMHRTAASLLLEEFETRLTAHAFLLGQRTSLADMAVMPFVRQFAHVDADWFAVQPWPRLQAWLAAWEASDTLAQVMSKFPPWQAGAPAVCFPTAP